MKDILFAVKEVLLTYSPERSFIEGMMKFDFKLQQKRTALMQICFANLAIWPLLILLFVIYLDPFKSSWSLVQLLSSESSIVLFLLDGRSNAMLSIFIGFFFIQWIFRNEYFFIFLIFYFLNRSELHINNALAALLAIYLARTAYMWWMGIENVSETKKIWNRVHLIQLICWALISILSVVTLDILQRIFAFNEVTALNRFNFLLCCLLAYHFLSHILLSILGHFYFKKTADPTDLYVHYSTSLWILRFSMSYYLRKLLNEKISEQMAKHEKNLNEFAELAALKQRVSAHGLLEVAQSELNYLREANLRLTKI